MLFKILWLKVRLGFLEKVVIAGFKLAEWAYNKGLNIAKDDLKNIVDKIPECEEKEQMNNIFKDLGL